VIETYKPCGADTKDAKDTKDTKDTKVKTCGYPEKSTRSTRNRTVVRRECHVPNGPVTYQELPRLVPGTSGQVECEI